MISANSTAEPSITDEDKNHVARQIQEGFTSGHFTGEDGARISWNLTMDIID